MCLGGGHAFGDDTFSAEAFDDEAPVHDAFLDLADC